MCKQYPAATLDLTSLPQLFYSELYDLDGCATFVADFIAYEVGAAAQLGGHLVG